MQTQGVYNFSSLPPCWLYLYKACLRKLIIPTPHRCGGKTIVLWYPLSPLVGYALCIQQRPLCPQRHKSFAHERGRSVNRTKLLLQTKPAFLYHYNQTIIAYVLLHRGGLPVSRILYVLSSRGKARPKVVTCAEQNCPYYIDCLVRIALCGVQSVV